MTVMTVMTTAMKMTYDRKKRKKVKVSNILVSDADSVHYVLG